MLKNNIFYSSVTADDFKKNMSSTYVEGGSPSLDQWSFIDIENAAIINSGTGKTGMVSFNLGLLFVGDVIEISAEFLNITGVKGKIGIDRTDVNGTFLGNTTVQSTNSDYYETLKISFVVRTEGYYKINFGLWTSDIGQLKIRKPMIKLETIGMGRDVERSATLLNEWTGDVYYKKNALGIATVYGTIKGGTTTAGTQIAVLPQGYRPLVNSAFLLMNEYGTTNTSLRFQFDGKIVVPPDVSFNTSLNYSFSFVFFTD